MDPLSVAASIISVAGALYAISRKLRSYAKTISYAAKEVKAIAREINLFSFLLRSLEHTYDTLRSRPSPPADLLELCEGVVALAKGNLGEFKSFLKALDPLYDSIDRGLISKTLARLKWAYRKSDLVSLRANLEYSKSTLTLYMIAIHNSILTEIYVAVLDRGGEETETRRLRRQVRRVQSQLRNQRSVVKDAIATSQKIEYLIRDKIQSSVNLEVAKEALSLTKRQLVEYKNEDPAQFYPRPIFTAPNNSSRLPRPVRVPSPAPAPSFPRTPPFPPRPHVSTGSVGRRRSTGSYSPTPSEGSIPSGPDQPRNSRAQRRRPGVPPPSGDVATDASHQTPRRHPGVPPPAGDVTIDVGHRTAQTFTPRGERGTRIRDAKRNIVWKEHYQADDEEGI